MGIKTLLAEDPFNTKLQVHRDEPYKANEYHVRLGEREVECKVKLREVTHGH